MSNTGSSAPSPPTLLSLCDYASEQTERIKSLLTVGFPGSRFKDPSNKAWDSFRSEVWGKGMGFLDTIEDVQRGPGAIDDPLILPDGVPLRCDAMLKPESLDGCRGLDCDKVFVRPEYEEAEKFFLSTFCDEMMYEAILVTGQPGIGFIPFLFSR